MHADIIDPDPSAIRSIITPEASRHAKPAGAFCWSLAEAARYPFAILITSFLFVPYFLKEVVGDPVRGQALYGSVQGATALVVAIVAPFLGAIADRASRPKFWVIGFMAVMAPATALLWYAKPGGGGISVVDTLALLSLCSLCWSFSEMFLNAMLPLVAPRGRIGQYSGLGQALANASGVLLMCAMLYAVILPTVAVSRFLPDRPIFGLDAASFETVRITGPLSGGWAALLMLPFLFFTPNVGPMKKLPVREAIRDGLRQIGRTVRDLPANRDVMNYFISRIFFFDGTTALFLFCGIYASGTFGWHSLQMAMFGIITATSSIVGGLTIGRIDDRLGSKAALLLSLAGAAIGLLIQISITPQTIFFLPINSPLPEPGSFLATWPERAFIVSAMISTAGGTGVQVAGRTLLAKLVPHDRLAEYFGLYAMSGTATAFLGPVLVAAVTGFSGSQRAGYASVLLLLLIGFLLLLRVGGSNKASAVAP